MPETEKYCDVCKAELKLGPTMKFAAFSDDDDNDQVLCPICKRNYMDPGDEMCAECREERSEKEAIEPDREVDPENDEEWRNYLDETSNIPTPKRQISRITTRTKRKRMRTTKKTSDRLTVFCRCGRI